MLTYTEPFLAPPYVIRRTGDRKEVVGEAEVSSAVSAARLALSEALADDSLSWAREDMLLAGADDRVGVEDYQAAVEKVSVGARITIADLKDWF